MSSQNGSASGRNSQNGSASRFNSRTESGNSKGRNSRQSSSEIRKSTESLNEINKRRSQESLTEVGVSEMNRVYSNESLNQTANIENETIVQDIRNERESSEECLLDEQGNVSSRRERKFSESKSDHGDSENIDTAIEEILNNNNNASYRTNSTIKSSGSFRLNKTDSITAADRQLLLRMTAEADNSPFHAGRFAESFTPRGHKNNLLDHDERQRLAESFTPRGNKRGCDDNSLRKPTITSSASQPHLPHAVDPDPKQTMAKIMNSFRKMEIYVGDHRRDQKKDVSKPEVSVSVPTSAVRLTGRPGTPNKARSAGKFTEIKQEKMTPRTDDSRAVKSSTRADESRAVKNSGRAVESRRDNTSKVGMFNSFQYKDAEKVVLWLKFQENNVVLIISFLL